MPAFGPIEKPFQQELINNAKQGYPNRSFGFVFGKRTGTVQNSVVDLWDWPTDTYVFPTAAQRMRVVSTSANDAAAGTGARKIEIHYLDANYVAKEEVVTLNGTTPVNTVATDIFRVNYVHTSEVGSGGVAAGNVSVQAIGGAVTYSYMQAGFNISRQSIYTVPDGVTGYINHWQASSGSTTGQHFTQVTLRATQHFGQQYPGIFLIIDKIGTSDNGQNITFPIPIRIPARTDVKISAISDTSNANVTALGAIMGWFENE